MIQIPIDVMVKKISEYSKLTEEDINTKIKQKKEQLSGLISEEGAAHIIANELGIKLFNMPEKLQIKNILIGMRNVETVGKVQQIFNVSEFETKKGKGKVGSFMIGDETGTIRVVCWHDQTSLLEKIKIGDIVKVIGALAKQNNNRKELHLNEKSRFMVNPEGVYIEKVKEFSSTRKKIEELKENDVDVEILGHIVQIFDLRFFEVCPECKKRTTLRGEQQFVCNNHGVVQPLYSYVLNLFLDDGTENIRVVCFKNQVERLLKKNEEEILKFKDNVQEFESIKSDLLGESVKFIGRVNKNTLFERLEFVAQLVFTDINLDEEISTLKAELTNT